MRTRDYLHEALEADLDRTRETLDSLAYWTNALCNALTNGDQEAVDEARLHAQQIACEVLRESSE